MWSGTRELAHRYLPANFHNPVALGLKLARSGDPAALLAMGSSGLGLLLTPLDLLLEPIEQRLYRCAPPSRHPLILVCGPPRSGTTLVAQTLIRNLELGYLNNLTALFPRSPIVANRLFGGFLERHEVAYRSYYGKSEHLSGPNDALYIWDRWMGSDRTRVPDPLDAAARLEVSRFFAAYEQLVDRPLLNKNNSLNTCAAMVGEAMPHARFICMRRDPVFLAQALLIARQDIHDSPGIPYGIHPPAETRSLDPVEDVCRQVLFFERMAELQQQRLGPGRFWIVSYERFCVDPLCLVKAVSENFLGGGTHLEPQDRSLQPFQVSRRVKVEPAIFRRMEETLERLREPTPEGAG